MALYKLQNFVKFRPKKYIVYASIYRLWLMGWLIEGPTSWLLADDLRHLLLDKSLSFVISSFPMFPEYSSQNWGNKSISWSRNYAKVRYVYTY